MATSYNWLNSYFDLEIPTAKEVEKGIIFHSFEVEGMEEKNGDFILDIKILPDRAHDCLCHTGVAGEVAAIFNLPKRKYSTDYGERKTEFANEKPGRELTVKIDCPDICRRYIGRILENVTIDSSPKWLQERLENAGQRAITNLVDATNYLMFDLGQPMHVFDADKVVGGITVRRAKDGEKMLTLDGKDLLLTSDNMVIADDEGVLALAGIKGGVKAEVDANTKNIILESANFDPVNVRRTSVKLGIRTDASKRYENDLSPEVAGEAMDGLTALLYEIAGKDNLKIGDKIDVYPEPVVLRQIKTSSEAINAILGLDVPKEEQEKILRNLDIQIDAAGEGWVLTIPARRVDLEIKENIAEEVGRIYGYDKVPLKLLDAKFAREKESDDARRFRVGNKIREILVRQGFSEVYGYAFAPKGDIEVANPLALDRPYLRTGLSPWLQDKLSFNLQHVLFDTDPVKIFEIGHVFKKEGEKVNETVAFAFGVARRGTKQKIQDIVNRELMEAKDALCRDLPLRTCPASDQLAQANNENNFSFALIETSLSDLIEMVDGQAAPDLSPYIALAQEYKKVSAFPRIIRDIALWVPENVTEDEITSLIKENAGPLLVQGPVLFDRFPKDGRVSYAFRQVFQSYEKTLSDEEVNGLMAKVTDSLKEKGWEVR